MLFYFSLLLVVVMVVAAIIFLLQYFIAWLTVTECKNQDRYEWPENTAKLVTEIVPIPAKNVPEWVSQILQKDFSSWEIVGCNLLQEPATVTVRKFWHNHLIECCAVLKDGQIVGWRRS